MNLNYMHKFPYCVLPFCNRSGICYSYIFKHSLFATCWFHRYSIMLKCWNSDPNERPPFSALLNSISGFAEKTAGYLDVSNYNPFEPNVPTATPGAESCDDQTEEEGDNNTGVSLDNPPVEINVQCPSEDEGSRDVSLLWTIIKRCTFLILTCWNLILKLSCYNSQLFICTHSSY